MFQERVLLVCLLSLLASRAAAGVINCTTSDFCTCKGTDGGKDFFIDVGSILSNYDTTKIPDTTSEGKDSYTYILSPCNPVACTNGGTANGVSCQNDLTGKGLAYVAKNTVPAKWNVAKLSPLQFVVVYGGGDQSKGPVLTRNAELDFNGDAPDDIEMFDEVRNTEPQVATLTYKFKVDGPKVVPGPAPSGGVAAGVVGLVLMSVSLVTLITYFIVGALVNYYRLGARGAEVIPNVNFWKDLPFLIKDGFLFTISPCYKRNQYQSL